MNFVNKIKELEKESLSDKDVLELTNYKTNLYTYPELAQFNNINEMLGEYGCCVILFLTKWHYGHWTACFRVNENTIEFFDSYGYMPDDEKEFIEDNFMKDSNQNRNYLSELLYKSGCKIIYNEYKLQKRIKGINTCGKHCCVRINNRLIPHKKYCEMLINKKYNPDFLVTAICLEYKNKME